MSPRASVPTPTQPVAADRAPLLHGLTVHDLERVALELEAELAASTRSVYASAWRQWEAWCRSRGLEALPADPEAVCAYLAVRAEAGLGYGSIDLTCCAIGYRHRHDGLSDPTADPFVRRVRRGLRRLLGCAHDHPAHPLTLAEAVASSPPSTRPSSRPPRSGYAIGP